MIAELSNISEQVKQRMQQIGTVDLVVGLADPKACENVAAIVSTVREGLTRLANIRAVVLVPNRTEAAAVEEAGEDESLSLFMYEPPALDPSITAAQNISGAYRAIWRISDELNARACAVLISGVENLTPQWIHSLVQPVLERNFDLVTPSYLQGKFDGMLNSSILYPLTRAIYGKQVLNPLGPDFGFSGPFVQHLLQLDSVRARTATGQEVVLIEPAAVVAKRKICQSLLGVRTYPPIEGDLSSVLAGILAPVFLTIERDAAFWQHIRSSETVPAFGERLTMKEESVDVDVRRLLESFQLGYNSLYEIWGVVLPPTILLELKKLNRLAPEQFRIPDELWARIVYEFAMAYRLRSIARDHLLRAMTPLYLGWVASYALEMEADGAVTVRQRLEKLCMAFENMKPYLVSRWRSPDRFNP
jgi:glucosylglycerate synthase